MSSLAMIWAFPGSSPRAWGLVGVLLDARGRRGIIPTSVGTGSGFPSGHGTMWDHPHERGDWVRAQVPSIGNAGSSPRAWGLAGDRAADAHLRGIIPTSVGTGPHETRAQEMGWDHPHERGDWIADIPNQLQAVGSSPRAWGLGTTRSSSGRPWGIIPTSVGTGLNPARFNSAMRDHPQERGDWKRVFASRSAVGGSSPRAWGLGRRAPALPPPRGIIPTSVGTGYTGSRPVRSRRDHPHERGDWIGGSARPCWLPGSSPRAWGLELGEPDGLGFGGIIPTSVGTGGCPSRRSPTPPDHPHERGDWLMKPCPRVCRPGSSPRAWGLGFRDQVDDGAPGIIPTSVGTGSARSCSSTPRRDHPHERGDW